MILKSPISQIGGKFFLRKWLNEKLPDHLLYCEPFCGGGHLLFYKPQSKVEVLNDTNNDLITFFKVVQDHEKRERLINLLNEMPYSRRIFRDLSSRWKYGDYPFDDVLRASEWFFLTKSCFSGDFHKGGFATGSVTGRNPCTTFRNTTQGLKKVSDRLKGVVIENLEYRACIHKYDSPDTLFFCDSPYWGTEDYYLKGCFANNDHYTLARLLNNVKGKVMLTHYENEIYDELYKGWNRYDYETFKVSRGITKSNKASVRPKVTEILYSNFDCKN